MRRGEQGLFADFCSTAEKKSGEKKRSLVSRIRRVDFRLYLPEVDATGGLSTLQALNHMVPRNTTRFVPRADAPPWPALMLLKPT